MTNGSSHAGLGARGISLAYVAFGAAWVAFSDRLVDALIVRQELLLQVQTVKGWLFVGLSGLLIYGLVTRSRRELAHKTERLERSVQQTSILHRILRHNLRNMCNVIRGHVDMLEEIESADVSEAECIDVIQDHTDELIEISEKSRHLRRAAFTDGGRSRPIDLAALVTDRVERLRRAHPDARIDVDVGDVRWANAGDELGVALDELVENAVEHGSTSNRTQSDDVTEQRSVGSQTSEMSDDAVEHGSTSSRVEPDDAEEHGAEGSPTVQVRLRREDETAVLEIADDGPGFPAAERAVLENRVEEPLEHSTGLGLWIARTIVAELGGSLDVVDTADGTAVRIRLPVAEEPAEPERDARYARPDPNSVRSA